MARAATVAEMRQTAQGRAISRALAHGGASCVRRVRCGLYKVQSATRPGMVHTVSVDAGGAYHCSCEAALAGCPACWHRASVYIARLEHNSGVRVTGPATRAPGEAAPSNVVDIWSRRAA